jgi:hypothetical protein
LTYTESEANNLSDRQIVRLYAKPLDGVFSQHMALLIFP